MPIELVEHHAKAQHMVMRKARIHGVHDRARQSDVAYHHRFHIWTKHLHHHVAPLIAGAVHLTQ